jgi:hypothetical protein
VDQSLSEHGQVSDGYSRYQREGLFRSNSLNSRTDLKCIRLMGKTAAEISLWLNERPVNVALVCVK